MSALLASSAAHLQAEVARAQAEGRLPSLAAGVLRDGRMVWTTTRGRRVRDGSADRPVIDTQYRIGSITKTFTAVLVMQLVDDGLVDLSEVVGRHVPEGPFADATLRSLLGHTAGLPAEPAGSWWERSRGVDYPRLAAAQAGAGRVHAAGERYHYSNLGYAVLGRVVENVRGRGWYETLRARVLQPLGMGRTTYHAAGTHAQGYSVESTTGILTTEPHQDTGAMAPAGQLWSTVGDLLGWLGFLADPDPAVLSQEAVAAMTTPHTADPDEHLSSAYGLGLRLCGPGPNVMVGHSGSMPGFLAGAYLDAERHTGAVVLANGAYGLDVEGLPRTLVDTVCEHEPYVLAEWTPNEQVEPATREILGRWYWGNAPFEMRIENGTLALRASGSHRVTTFRPAATDTWVGCSGYLGGETMHVLRRPDGTVSHLDIGTFCYTRVPYDPSVPVPGADDVGR